MLVLPEDSEIDFGKILVIDKSYQADEDDVRKTCRANSARKIWFETSTEAENLLVENIEAALSHIYEPLEHPIDVYFVDGPRLVSDLMPLKYGPNTWFNEISIVDFKLLHNINALYIRCEALTEYLDNASNLTSVIVSEMLKRNFTDPTIVRLNSELPVLQENLAVSLITQFDTEIKRILRKAW